MVPPTSDVPHTPTFAPVPSIAAPQLIAGWRLNFAAGFVPLVAGLITLATSWINVTHPDAPWSIGGSSLGFSFSSLQAVGADAATYVEVMGSVGGVNIVGAAIAVIVIARFGLRDGRRWAWWFLAFCLVWIGVHDAVMGTRFFLATGQPFMVLPLTYCALMLAGLVRSRRAVFGLSTAVEQQR